MDQWTLSRASGDPARMTSPRKETRGQRICSANASSAAVIGQITDQANDVAADQSVIHYYS